MLNIAFFVCMLLIFLASLPIWRYVIRRIQSKQPVLELRNRLSSPIGLVDLGIMLFVWLFSQLIAGVLFANIAGVQLSKIDSMSGGQLTFLMLIAAIAQLIAVTAGLAYLMFRYSDHRVLGWYPEFHIEDLQLAVYAFLVITPVVLPIQMILSAIVKYEHPALEALFQDASAFSVASIWLTTVIGAPIAEEVIFRGWVQNWLQRMSFDPVKLSAVLSGGWWQLLSKELDQATKAVEGVSQHDEPKESCDVNVLAELRNDSDPFSHLGSISHGEDLDDSQTSSSLIVKNDSCSSAWNWGAIVITSVLFALMHLGQGLAPIPLFMLSLLIGYLYQRTGSILPCIGLHMLNNGYSVFWMTLQILLGESGELP